MWQNMMKWNHRKSKSDWSNSVAYMGRAQYVRLFFPLSNLAHYMGQAQHFGFLFFYASSFLFNFFLIFSLLF
jgi:hypothetical protein